MGLLKKLFKKQTEDTPRDFRPRELRVRLLPLHNVFFNMSSPRVLGDLPLVNLSYGGMGLLTEPFGKPPQMGDALEGTLVLEEAEIPIRVRVAHTSEALIGCQLIEPTQELKRQMQKYFDLEIKALEMTTVPDGDLHPDKEGTPHWITGDNNCELFFIEKNNDIQSFRLSYFGNTLEYQKGLPIRFGVTFETGLIYAEKSEPPRHQMDLKSGAIKFVTNIRTLQPHFQAAIKKAIEES